MSNYISADRLMEVKRLLAEGYSPWAISQKIRVSQNTAMRYKKVFGIKSKRGEYVAGYLTDEKRKRIEDRLKAGDSVLTIVREENSSPNTIMRIRERLGIEAKRARRPQISDLTRKNIQSMIRFGGSLYMIAKVNGVNERTVYAIRDKMTNPETLNAIHRPASPVSVPSRKKRAVRNKRARQMDHPGRRSHTSP